jgi:DNA-binding NarL/FixJ family response regulator
VLDYLNETLLVLNLIGVIYLIARKRVHKEVDKNQSVQIRMIETNEEMKREIFELKTAMEHLSRVFQQKNEQWVLERKAVEAAIPAGTSSKNAQNLLLNDRYKEIFELRNQGFTVEQIAKKLEKGNGEVSMILQLAENTGA